MPEPDLLMLMREAAYGKSAKGEAPLLAALREQFKNDPGKFIQRMEEMENNYLISQGLAIGPEKETDEGTRRAVEHAEKLLKALLENGNAAQDHNRV